LNNFNSEETTLSTDTQTAVKDWLLPPQHGIHKLLQTVFHLTNKILLLL